MEQYKTGNFLTCLNFLIYMAISVIIRLITPLKLPNIEPILAMQIPVSKKYGYIEGFLFAFFNILIFDFITFKLGIWTIITAITYGLIGLAAKRFITKTSVFHYGLFACAGTLFYDSITCLTIGPLLFNQPVVEAILGQIPFSGMHLISNLFFVVILSPVIERLIMDNKKTLTGFFWEYAGFKNYIS